MMTCICCEVIDMNIVRAAQTLAQQQKRNVYIISLTESLEVAYEEVSEVPTKEAEKILQELEEKEGC